MKRRFNRKGFTMAELLLVVGIIVILLAVGFIGIISYQRTLHQLEMDGHAKEIFVAAQNHLAMADSQGYLGISSKRTDTYEPFGMVEDADKGVYYYIVSPGLHAADANNPNNKNSALNQLLPLASVDESVRTGGSYIIRYQKSPAVVLDVFYASTSDNRFKHIFTADEYNTVRTTLSGDDKKSARRDYGGAVIGYYGGEGAAAKMAGDTLVAPTLIVENEETLRVVVTDVNNDASAWPSGKVPNSGANSLTLVIKGKESLAEMQMPLVVSGTAATGDRIKAAGNRVTVTLDDVTKLSLHFAGLTADIESFIRGEEISVKAVAFNNNLVSNIAESGESVTNSLFASITDGKDDSNNPIKVANIAHVRHLLNLDPAISGFSGSGIGRADQISDLSWKTFKTDTNISTTNIIPFDSAHFSPLGANNYYPINPGYNLNYDGKSHKISDVECSVAENMNAGLFGTVSGGSVSNLELIDFNLSAKGNVGALAGELTGGSVTGVLVRNIRDADESSLKISAAASAGGLIGSMTGGTVDQCAAAVYVETTGSAAGGLIGKVNGSDLQVTNSYSGGHTDKAKYQELAIGKARYNVSAATYAGGLIGDASGVSVQYCYSTSSAKGGTAAGLVGNVGSGVTVEYCYSVGKVFGSSKYTFLGAGGTSDSLEGTNFILDSVTPEATSLTNGAHFKAIFSSETTSLARKFLMELPATADGTLPRTQNAITYDETLLVNHGGKYLFPTVEQLHTETAGTSWTTAYGFLSTHYGDWQVPSMLPVEFTLKNEDKLYSEITLLDTTKYLTIGVKGETSGQVRMFVLDVRDSTTNELYTDKADITLYELQTGASGSLSVVTTDLPSLNIDISGTKLTFRLDDLTTGGGHFAQLCSNLYAGENFTLYVGSGKGSWEELVALGAAQTEETKMPKTDSSLFAKTTATPTDGGKYNAQIKNFRHLQNLDVSTSNVSSQVSKAALINDLNWTSESGNYSTGIYNCPTSSSTPPNNNSGHFVGIANQYLTELDGQNKTIKNLYVRAATGNYISTTNNAYGALDAGLFRYVNGGLTVKDLKIEDPDISADGNVGAVAGNAGGGLTLDTVLALSNDKVITSTGTGAAGGLVGLSASLSINNSASAMRVQAVGDAGGLVGKHSSTDTSNVTLSVTNSYVGGHTVNTTGRYYVENSATGGWNVVSTGSGAAGGILGRLDSGSASMSQSFSAASVWADAAKAAGGIVGISTGSFDTMNYVYTVAPVYGVKTTNDTADSNGGLIGSAFTKTVSDGDTFLTPTQVSFSGDVFYLPDVYSTIKPRNELGVSQVTTIGGGSFAATSVPRVASYFDDQSPTIVAIRDSDASTLEQETIAYDSALNGKREYPFRMWTAFGGKRIFYGDWEPVDNEPTQEFLFKFLREDPTKQVAGISPIVQFAKAKDRSRTVAVQMLPFKVPSITVPAIPVVNGFEFGMESLVDSSDPDNVTTLVRSDYWWTVYYGDVTLVNGQITGSLGEGVAHYNVSSGTINVNETDIRRVAQIYANLNKDLAENAKLTPCMTLVAHYRRITDRYTVQFLDYNPADYPANPDVGTVDYEPLGGLQAFLKTYEGGAETFTTLYTAYEATPSKLFVPTRSVPGYKFRGWYSAELGDSKPVFIQNSSGQIVKAAENDEDGTNSNDVTINKDITLYSYYQPTLYNTITINFNVTLQNGQTVHLSEAPVYNLENDSQYQIQYDIEKGYEADVALPGTLTVASVSTNSEFTWPNHAVRKVHVKINPISSSDAQKYYNGTAMPEKTYTVTFSGTDASALVGYVIRYEMLDTDDSEIIIHSSNENATNLTDLDFSKNTYPYNKDEAAVFNPYNGYESQMNLRTMVDVNPRLNKDILDIDGFHLKSVEYKDIADMTDTQLDHYEVSFTEETVEGETKNKVTLTDANGPVNVQYVVVVQFERNVHLLHYNTNEGSPIVSEEVPYGAKIIDFTKLHNKDTAGETVRNGYDFDSWRYGADDTKPQVTDANLMPDEETTVTAKWNAKNVAYGVAFWYENADDDGYSYMGSVSFSEEESTKKVGQTIKVTDSYDGNASHTWKDYSFSTERDDTHFTYDNNSGYPTEVPLKADGSSVLNIYFKRKLVTIKFYAAVKYSSYTYYDTDSVTDANTLYNSASETDDIDYFYWDQDTDGTNNWYPLRRFRSDGVYTWERQHSYEDTTNDNITNYGVVAGEYVPLDRIESGKTYEWTPEYVYEEAPGNNDNGSVYGLENGEYFLITKNGNNWYKWSYTEYTQRYDGSFWFLDDNGEWAYHYFWERNGPWHDRDNGDEIYEGKLFTRSRSSTKYTGDRYTRRSGGEEDRQDDTITRYTRSGDALNGFEYEGTNSYKDGRYFYKDTNQGYVRVFSSTTTSYTWSYNNQPYTKTRYEQKAGDRYTGTRYVKNEDGSFSAVDASNSDDDPQKYSVDEGHVGEDGTIGHVPLNRAAAGDYYWAYYKNGKWNKYSGTFYWFNDETSYYDSRTKNVMTWTGKYQSKLTLNNYDWSWVDYYSWYFRSSNYSSYTQTFMYAFTSDEIDGGADKENGRIVYKLYLTGHGGSNAIYHYRELLGGGYSQSVEYRGAAYSNNTGSFNFSKKYNQFTPYKYAVGSNGFYTDPDATGASTYSVYSSGTNFGSYSGGIRPIHVYHARNKYTLSYFNASTTPEKVVKVKYEEKFLAPVNSYTYENGGGAVSTFNYTPANPSSYPASQGYYFDGWYSDETLSTRYVWTDAAMPDYNLNLYAKWIRPDQTVTFNLDTNEGAKSGASSMESVTVAHSATLKDENNVVNGVFATDGNYTPAYEPVRYKTRIEGEGDEAHVVIVTDNNGKPVVDEDQVFRYWYYTTDGNRTADESKHKKVYPGLAIENNLSSPKDTNGQVVDNLLNLYAWFEAKSQDTYSSVTIVKALYDEDGKFEKNVPMDPISVDDDGNRFVVGDTYEFTAPNVDGYTVSGAFSYLTVKANAAENVVTFKYTKVTPWTYTLTYYITYESQPAQSYSWITGTFESSSISFPVLKIEDDEDFDELTTVEVTARYDRVFGVAPNWLSGYTFDHFSINTLITNPDETVTVTEGYQETDSMLVVNKENAGGKEIGIYFKPDQYAIMPGDQYATYDGDPKASDKDVYSETNENLDLSPVSLPADELMQPYALKRPVVQSVTAEQYYAYFGKSDGSYTSISPVNVGSYGARSYIVVNVHLYGGATKNYLLWVSSDNTDGSMPMHLFIEPRNVFLKSADITVANGNVARADPAHPENSVDESYNPYGLTEYGFVSGQGVKKYIFAADAFRTIVGTSKNANVFEYEIDTATTIESNYNIYTFFGDLTVTP